MARKVPLSAPTISKLLDDWLEVEFSFRDTKTSSQLLVELPRETQDHVLTWVQRVASTNIELAYQFAVRAPQVLKSVDFPIVEAWLLHAMDVYDQFGLRAAKTVMEDVDCFIQSGLQSASGVVLSETVGVLLPFIQGLSGRKLSIEESEDLYTDSEILYLPSVVAYFPEVDDNFTVYKAMATLLWAQTRFGTFRVPIFNAIQQGRNQEKFLGLFQSLEHIRLEARIEEELPGLYRDIQRINELQDNRQYPENLSDVVTALRKNSATTKDTLRFANDLFGKKLTLPTRCYHGAIRPDRVHACMAQRILREKQQFRTILRKISDETNGQRAIPDSMQEPGNFSKKLLPDSTHPDGWRFELSLDGQPLVSPDSLKNAMNSIVQDLSDIYEEYLVVAGSASYDSGDIEVPQNESNDVWSGTYHEEGAYLYHEWDYRRQLQCVRSRLHRFTMVLSARH